VNEDCIADQNAEKVCEGKLETWGLLGRPSVYTIIILKWISNKMGKTET
jgi:hypothetical protein